MAIAQLCKATIGNDERDVCVLRPFVANTAVNVPVLIRGMVQVLLAPFLRVLEGWNLSLSIGLWRTALLL